MLTYWDLGWIDEEGRFNYADELRQLQQKKVKNDKKNFAPGVKPKGDLVEVLVSEIYRIWKANDNDDVIEQVGKNDNTGVSVREKWNRLR